MLHESARDSTTNVMGDIDTEEDEGVMMLTVTRDAYVCDPFDVLVMSSIPTLRGRGRGHQLHRSRKDNKRVRNYTEGIRIKSTKEYWVLESINMFGIESTRVG